MYTEVPQDSTEATTPTLEPDTETPGQDSAHNPEAFVSQPVIFTEGTGTVKDSAESDPAPAYLA